MKRLILSTLPLLFVGCSPAFADMSNIGNKTSHTVDEKLAAAAEPKGMRKLVKASVDAANEPFILRQTFPVIENMPYLEPGPIIPRYRYHRLMLCLYQEQGYVALAEDSRRKIAMMKPYVE